MKVGFTGTRQGMTDAQRATIAVLIRETVVPTVIYHGDCHGADDEFANICHEACIGIRIVACPGLNANGSPNALRANNPHATETWPARTHFARNRDIVEACDVLIVAPWQSERATSGGTWYTHDYAVKKGKRVIVVWPDGSVLAK